MGLLDDRWSHAMQGTTQFSKSQYVAWTSNEGTTKKLLAILNITQNDWIESLAVTTATGKNTPNF